jgi:tRNA G18 (ribose-2'-O)-methylase SpoU
VLEGLHPLKHAMRFGARIVLAVTPDPAALGRLTGSLAPDVAAAVAAMARPVSPVLFARLAPNPPATGVLALAHRPAVDMAALLTGPDRGRSVLLRNSSDLGNIGAVVRVAAAAGAAAVLTTGRHDPWHPTALRGSAGLHFAVPVARLDDLPRLARPLVAVDPSGERLGARPLPAGALLVFGSERDGLGADLLARAEYRVAIPMRPGVSSLNLATAVAVMLYAEDPLPPPGAEWP